MFQSDLLFSILSADEYGPADKLIDEVLPDDAKAAVNYARRIERKTAAFC